MCFQVFSKGPDDKVYNANKDLREKVARGNSVLYINDLESKTIEQDCIIFALRKFTGGMYVSKFLLDLYNSGCKWSWSRLFSCAPSFM